MEPEAVRVHCCVFAVLIFPGYPCLVRWGVGVFFTGWARLVILFVRDGRAIVRLRFAQTVVPDET